MQGNYNATSANVEAEPNRPAAIIGDAITILSNNWSDANSFNNPNDMAARDATDTGYRFAMIAGKSMAFPKPGWARPATGARTAASTTSCACWRTGAARRSRIAAR